MKLGIVHQHLSVQNFAIMLIMKQKTLIQTNQYLKDHIKARRLLIRSLASSTAIETGEAIEKLEEKLTLKHFSRYRVKLA